MNALTWDILKFFQILKEKTTFFILLLLNFEIHSISHSLSFKHSLKIFVFYYFHVYEKSKNTLSVFRERLKDMRMREITSEREKEL